MANGNATQHIVNKAWSFAHVLRDDGLSYMGYTEQIPFLLFLKRSFAYDELLKRDKLNLDIFWLRDRSLEDSENLPEPDVLAQEIADELQTALEQFASIAAELKR
jgi:hypothetical protein